MINYPYLVRAAVYSPRVKAGLFRSARPALLALRLTAPAWSRRDGDLADVRVFLSGPDAAHWHRLAPGDPVRAYGRPSAAGDSILDLSRLKRGHRNFPTSTSHRLKEAPST
jgi:hypothetical protein